MNGIDAPVDWRALMGDERGAKMDAGRLTEGDLDIRAFRGLEKLRRDPKAENVRGAMQRYRDYRKGRGEQPFQYLKLANSRQRADDLAARLPAFEKMFGGVDTMEEGIPEDRRRDFIRFFADSLNPERDKMQAANKLAVEAFTGQPADSYGDAWNAVRSNVARQLWDTRGVVTDEQFYQLAGKHFRKERERLDEQKRKRELAGEFSNLGFEAAVRGRNWFDGWRESGDALDKMAGGDRGFAMEVFRQSNELARKEIGDLPAKTRIAFQYLAKRAGKDTSESYGPNEKAFANDAEFADWLGKLPDQDFTRLLGAMQVAGKYAGHQYQGFATQLSQAVYGALRESGQSLTEPSASVFQRAKNIVQEKPNALIDENGVMNHATAGLIGVARVPQDVLDEPSLFEKRPGQPFGQLTAAGRREFLGRMDSAIKQTERLAMMRAIQGDAAPMVAGSWLPEDVEMGLYDAGGSTAQTALAFAGPMGLMANAQVMARQNEAKLMFDAPGMDATTRQNIAGFAGLLQSAEETLLTKFAFGRFKGLRQSFSKIGAGRAGARFGLNLLAGTAAEMFEEKVQDATLPVVQELFRGLGADAPAVDWEREWKQIAGGNARLFFAVLPLTLIGAGVATHSDIRDFNAITANRSLLQAARLSNEDIAAIIAEQNPGKRQGVVREAFRKRDKEQLAREGFTGETVKRIGAIDQPHLREDARLDAEWQQQQAEQAMQGTREIYVDPETGETMEKADPTGPLNAELDFIADLERRGMWPEIRPADEGVEVTTPEGETSIFQTLPDAISWAKGWVDSLGERAASPQAADDFRSDLEAMEKGTLPTQKILSLGQPSPALKSVGAAGPLTITQGVVKKAIGRHGIPLENIRELPEEIADPIMIFQSDEGPSRRVVLTEMRDESGRPIVVALDVDISRQGIPGRVTDIRSVHPKENDGRILNWIDKGRVLYHDEQRSQAFLQGSAPSNWEQHAGTLGSAKTKAQVTAERNPDADEGLFRKLESQLASDTREATPSSIAEARSLAAREARASDTEGSTVSGHQGVGHVAPSLVRLPAVGKPVSAPKVIESLTKTLRVIGSKVPLRVGRAKRGTLGVYYVRQRLIRLRTANDITTAAHEVAHALEDALFGRKHDFDNDPTVPQRARDELVQLGHALYGNQIPNGGYASEGFAEFFRITVEGGLDHARNFAPAFANWFDSDIMKPNPRLAKSIDQVIAEVSIWNRQGSIERAKQSIAPTAPRLERLRESMLTFFRTAEGRFIDMAFPLKRFVEEAEARAGVTIAPEANPWETLQARRLTADSVAGYMVEHGMLDFYGNRVGKGLAEVLAPVRGKQDDFLVYLWARRTMALTTDGKDRNSGLSVADAQHIISQLDSPAFQLAAQGVYDWNNGVLDYAAQASPDFANVVKMIRDADPGQYIPLFREFKAFDERYRRLATDAKSGNLVKRLKGSGRRIKNPVEGMIAQARALVQKSQQKAILDQIIRIGDTVEGLGDLIFEVPVNQVPGAVRDVESVLADVSRQMKAHGASQSLQDAMADVRQMAGKEQGVAEAMLTFFVPAQTAKPGEDPIIPIFHNGKRRWFEVSRNVYEAINGMEIYRLSKVLDIFLGVPARTLRLGTTGLRASFSLVTNPLRDFRTLMLNSQANANPGELFLEWMRQVGNGGLAALSGGQLRNEWAETFERLGGSMATPLGQDTLPTKRAAKRLFAGRVVRTVDPRNWLDFTREILQFPEKASRIAELKLVARDLGWEPGMPLDAATAARLINAAKQVTTDFTAAGNVARVLNQALPFFNAQIQGPRAHVRAIQRDPGKFLIRGLYGTAAALALWWRYRDEDWWEEMPASEKYGYTYIPFDAPDGSKELIRIPRSFEADGVFMAGAQALADAWYQNEPEEASAWFGRLLASSEPSLPPLVENELELRGNKDRYFGSPIVPKSEEDLPPEEQFNEWTSTAAIELGRLTGTSPRKIEHSVRSMFGGVGTDIMAVFGRGERGDQSMERERELADIPVVGVLFQRGGQFPRSAKAIDALYDQLDKARMRQRSRKVPETPEQAEIRLQLNDAAKAIAYISDVMRLEWSKEDRRKMNQIRVGIARDAVEMAAAGEVDREKFREIRMGWQREAESR